MYAKRVKRKCSVRGCKNTDCFSISRTREMGNSVIICRSCLCEALNAVDSIKDAAKSGVDRDNKPNPPLFYNAQALGLAAQKGILEQLAEEVTDPETETIEQPTEEVVTEAVDDAESLGFVCTKCGRKFDSQRGLTVHLKTCKGHE